MPAIKFKYPSPACRRTNRYTHAREHSRAAALRLLTRDLCGVVTQHRARQLNLYDQDVDVEIINQTTLVCVHSFIQCLYFFLHIVSA